jgi:hypothetical protein
VGPWKDEWDCRLLSIIPHKTGYNALNGRRTSKQMLFLNPNKLAVVPAQFKSANKSTAQNRLVN